MKHDLQEGEFIIIAQYNGFGRAGIFTETTVNAAQHIDLIRAGISFAR
jgi:hypothetical protein